MICRKINTTALLVANPENEDVETPGAIDNDHAYVEVPENLLNKFLLVKHSEEQGYYFEEDVKTRKSIAIAILNAQTWKTIMAEALNTYGTDDPILILASHSTYQDMVSHPLNYVGDIFADSDAVLAYAQPKLTESSEFGKWRFGVLAQEQIEKAAIEAE